MEILGQTENLSEIRKGEQVAMLSLQTLEDKPAPSGYATSKYSAEEMDALLDRVAALEE